MNTLVTKLPSSLVQLDRSAVSVEPTRARRVTITGRMLGLSLAAAACAVSAGPLINIYGPSLGEAGTSTAAIREILPIEEIRPTDPLLRAVQEMKIEQLSTSANCSSPAAWSAGEVPAGAIQIDLTNGGAVEYRDMSGAWTEANAGNASTVALCHGTPTA